MVFQDGTLTGGYAVAALTDAGYLNVNIDGVMILYCTPVAAE